MKLTVGVIGLGIGKHHIEGYRSNPNCTVIAIADTDKAKLDAVGDQYGIPNRFTSAEALIDSGLCQVISVATPNKFHKDLTNRALEKGAHVLCEKPMAMNAAEGQTMLETALKTERRLMINFSYRFTMPARALKARIDQGDLGQAYYGRSIWLRRRGMPGFGGWFGNKELAGGGPLIDLGVHRLDLALWFMGYPEVDYVTGTTYAPIATEIAQREHKTYSVEDLAAGFIRFKNGASLSMEASWAGNIKENELMETRILGSRGGLIHRNIGEGYEFEAEFFTEHLGYQWDEKYHAASSWAAGNPKPITAMSHFIDSIIAGTPHEADGKEGLLIMKILDALYQSAESGRPVIF
ncbi:Gfo/Idh/MocA family protein [Gracilinema caldarium]|uniref:Gfo/Idh/MocA family protein n=1 Tax=Gracilinema caldarium TaxID=215591 RepID=UPI0026EA46A6|nr:Gfo/Idh/MocA family oxidoreductase [Gracilinema caldarium]